jgi:tetratricopeptide (TPR) repeat protein
MATQRHQSSAELPPAPLDFAFPLAVPGAEVLGAVIMFEAPTPFSLHLFQALRIVMAWAEGAADSGELFDDHGMRAWEAQILTTEGVDEALWAPVGVIAAEMCRPDDVDVPRLTRACLAIADWAIGYGAHGTALAFAEAAAAAWPNNARMAWMTGRLFREHGQLAKAEVWALRAKRVAVWTGDPDAQALALISLGKLRVLTGDFATAREHLNSAVRLAKRHRLSDRHASALHNLFAVSIYTGRFDEAEGYAKQAANAYGSSHPDLINLAFDVSNLWLQQGHFARALSVLREMEGRFEDPDRRVRVAASTARAAGAVGEVDTFHAAWSDAWALLESGTVDHLRAAAPLELGLGALSLKLWDHAEQALTVSRTESETRREGDTLAKAEAAIENLERRQSVDRQVHAGRRAATGAHDLAGQLARSLMEQWWAPVQDTGARDG